MTMKYGLNVENKVLKSDIVRLTNRVYKLLPTREEGGDWISPLNNLIVDIVGMNNLFCGQIDMFPLICKMEGIRELTNDEDFFTYRTNIFECLSMLSKIKECLD